MPCNSDIKMVEGPLPDIPTSAGVQLTVCVETKLMVTKRETGWGRDKLGVWD